MRLGHLVVPAIALALAACERGAPTPPRAAETTASAEAATPPRVPEVFDHVLLISVDGLRPDCLETPLIAQFPNFARILSGPHTLEARTDPDYTVTLPNHLSMLTGRPVLGPSGHGWIANTDPPAEAQGGTLHAQKRSYVQSVFDVAHDHGVDTTIAVTKTKFVLLTQSYSDASGAPDTVGRDDGRQKIDRALYTTRASDLGGIVADTLRRSPAPSFAFVHIGAPDFAGHATGWDLGAGSAYLKAVKDADGALGTILDAIESSPGLRGNTAIVLTADHGGGVPFKSHTDKAAPINFRIPFAVWLGGGAVADLRALNPARAWPDRDTQLDTAVKPQPIRNGDAGNLCLRLLGLPPIDGSLYGAADQLAVTREEPPKTLPSKD